MPVIGLLQLIAATLVCALSAQTSSAQVFEEDKLKAIYLVNLASYIRWDVPKDDVVLCLQSNTDVFSHVRGLAGFELGEQRRLALNIDPERLDTCHMLYWGGSAYDRAFLPTELSRHSELIVVSDHESSPEYPVDIHLFVQDFKLRFRVNQALLEDRAFKISSKLLRLAREMD